MLCSADSVQTKSKTEKIKRVYENFGNIQYEGDRYLAFTEWWNTKLENGETRDAYLFAEPLTEMKVELVDDVATAKQLLAKQVGLVVEQRNSDEEWDIAYIKKGCLCGCAQEKKVALNAINNVLFGHFP